MPAVLGRSFWKRRNFQLCLFWHEVGLVRQFPACFLALGRFFWLLRQIIVFDDQTTVVRTLEQQSWYLFAIGGAGNETANLPLYNE